MSKVLQIAEKRIQGSLDRLLEKIDEDYEAMLRMHSSKGLLRSGNTIKESMNLVTNNCENLKAIIIEQSQWAIKQSIYVPLSILNDLVTLCNEQFDRYIADTEAYLEKGTKMAGKPELFSRYYPEVKDSVLRNRNETVLEIEALVYENRSSGIKGIAKYIFSMASKLWGG